MMSTARPTSADPPPDPEDKTIMERPTGAIKPANESPVAMAVDLRPGFMDVYAVGASSDPNSSAPTLPAAWIVNANTTPMTLFMIAPGLIL
jgi:hypothetical protein